MKKKAEEVIIDFLNIPNMKIVQRNDHFNFSLDTVLIANFLTINRSTKMILDMGTGNGAIPLLLSKRTTANITGIEIQEVSVQLAKKNIEINNLQKQIKIVSGDIKAMEEIFNEKFDAIVTNPPFFKLDGNENQLNNLDQLSLARHEVSLTLKDIIANAEKLLKTRGYFAMVHRADRLSEILNLLEKYKLEPKRLQFTHSNWNKPSKIILIEALKGAKKGLKILPPLITNNEKGGYSEIVKKMFCGEYI